jgi:MOSC domain-containing protein YiiM
MLMDVGGDFQGAAEIDSGCGSDKSFSFVSHQQEELERPENLGQQRPMEDLSPSGSVVAVASDQVHHFSKTAQRDIELVEGHGVEGDAHAGALVRHRYLARRQPHLPNLRQVHLIPSELFGTLRQAGYEVGPGDLGENVTTEGLALERLPLGTRIRLGSTATVELTGLRTPCVLIDRFRPGLKRHVVSSEKTGPAFTCGVMGVVTAGSRITAGDRAHVLLPDRPLEALPSL